jgi:hypothetical protein
MENENALHLGIASFKAGEKDKARFYFLKAVREEPNSESAWGWLSNTAVTTDDQIYCLKQVIRINPQNNSAAKLLKELESNEWAKVAPIPLSNSREAVARKAPPIRSFQPSNKVQKNSFLSGTKAILIVAGALILIVFLSLIASTVFGPLINSEYNRITSGLGGTPTPIGSMKVGNLTILPVGSKLKYNNWSYHIDAIEITGIIQFNGDIYYPKNGRFAILYLAGTNIGYSPDYLIPQMESEIIDANGNAFLENSALSAAEAFSKNWEPGVKLNPGQTDKILAVYDISASSKTYLFTIGIINTGVLLNMPTP